MKLNNFYYIITLCNYGETLWLGNNRCGWTKHKEFCNHMNVVDNNLIELLKKYMGRHSIEAMKVYGSLFEQMNNNNKIFKMTYVLINKDSDNIKYEELSKNDILKLLNEINMQDRYYEYLIDESIENLTIQMDKFKENESKIRSRKEIIDTIRMLENNQEVLQLEYKKDLSPQLKSIIMKEYNENKEVIKNLKWVIYEDNELIK